MNARRKLIGSQIGSQYSDTQRVLIARGSRIASAVGVCSRVLGTRADLDAEQRRGPSITGESFGGQGLTVEVALSKLETDFTTHFVF